MEVGMMQYPPGDSRMIDKIVYQLKSQGIFDQFRKECIADVDTKPAYQNLHQRVEGSVSGFLASQEWRPDLNKNQLRDSLRKHIHESGFLDIGVERIVDQVVNPKIMTVFMPQVEDVVYKFLGIERPKKGKENQNVYIAPLTTENLAKKEERKLPTLTDLLPKELEPISPESDTIKGKDDSFEDEGDKEEDSSPAFEPIEEANYRAEDSSMDSHLSGISELTSHDSRHSPAMFGISTQTNNSSATKVPMLDLTNNDSQLSKVSSGSRLSIVSLSEHECKPSYDYDTNEESQQSKSSFRVHSQETRNSGTAPQLTKQESDFVKEGNSNIKQHDSDSAGKDDHAAREMVNESDFVSSQIPSENINEKMKDIGSRVNSEHAYDDKTERILNEKHDKKVDNEYGENSLSEWTYKPDDRYSKKMDESFENPIKERPEKEINEKPNNRVDEPYEKSGERFEQKLDDKCERKLDEKLEKKPETKSEKKFDEKKNDDKSERKVDEKNKKLAEKIERKPDDKPGKKLEEKHERKSDEKSEKKLDKSEKKSEEKSEKRLDEKSERKLDEKSEKKLTEKSEKKSDEKSLKKSDDRSVKKADEKSDRKSNEKYDKKLGEKIEKKADDKSDRKSDSKPEKKVDEKYERKQDRHREDKDKSKEKKKFSENKDTKKDHSNHSSENEKKRSDKDKHKKDIDDGRNRVEKSSKHEREGTKEKLQHEDKTERDITKEKFKQDVKDSKDDKRSDEKKTEKDVSKEKSKKDDGEGSKHDKDAKKSRSDERRERDGKEKSKSEDRGRLKHDDKHRDRTKSEGRDKEKSSRHEDRSSKDGSRSSSKESKDRIKQDSKDRGKEMSSKSDEKKSKEKSRHEEKTSNKSVDKRNIKKGDKRKDEADSSKTSRSSDHKNRESGKKGKENKEKGMTDDHRIHRDKHSDDRRSTDRDSNGTAHARSFGSTTSRTNGNDSQSQSHREKTSGSSSSNSSKSDSGGNSEASGTEPNGSSASVEDQIPSTSKSSPPSSLPFKKRPLAHSDDEQSDDEVQSVMPCLPIKKPKIAANIFEVRKIMMLRKCLAKKERKRKRELQRRHNAKVREEEEDAEKRKLAKPVDTKRKKLGDVEESLREEMNTSMANKQVPQLSSGEEESPEVKYFEPELVRNALTRSESEFLTFIKKLDDDDNLSQISVPSDSGSDAGHLDDPICLSGSDFDDIVAVELGAKIVKTDESVDVVLDVPHDKVVMDKVLSNKKYFSAKPHPTSEEESIDPDSLTPSAIANVIGNVREVIPRLSVDSRSNSALSNWSDRSSTDIPQSGEVVKRILRQRSSSVASTTSNKSVSDKMEKTTNGLNTGKVIDVAPKLRRRVFSKRRTKKEIIPVPETNPPQSVVEKHDLRKTRQPSTRYSSKTFVSPCTKDGTFVEEDENFYGFPKDRITIENNTIQQRRFSHDSVSGAVVVLNDISKNIVDKRNNMSPVSSEPNKICITETSISSTVTKIGREVDSSDDDIVSIHSVGDDYSIIGENNNIDKGSSDDERDSENNLLNEDLIRTTLHDLMLESGFRRKDDNSDFLPSSINVVNSRENSLTVTDGNVENSERRTSICEYDTVNKEEKVQPKLGRSRRVGLSRPPPKQLTDRPNNDVGGNRTVTPPSSDFVMPLSPESDISASSGEAKKTLLESKVTDSLANPSPSISSDKAGHMANNQHGDGEQRRNLRSGGLGTPASRGQRYSSDDLYKPRPLFSQSSRRVRGQVSTSFIQENVNCTSKRPTSDIVTSPPLTVKRRR